MFLRLFIGSNEGMETLPRHEQRQFLQLAGHIASRGLNPADLPIITPAANTSGYFTVLDGKRRIMALKALEKPDLLAASLDPDILARLRCYSKTYHPSQIADLLCVCVENRSEAASWIELRHSTVNPSTSIMPWNSLESSCGENMIAHKQLWSPHQMALVIMAVHRPENYLVKTMNSLVSADSHWRSFKEIGIAVDGITVDWMPNILNPQQATIVPLNDKEQVRVNGYKLHRRACHNYYRSLQLLHSYRGLIICEDDVIFRDGWIDKLCQSLNEMQTRKVDRFVLSLYSPHDHRNGSLRRGDYYSSYVANSFYGTQCVFYSSSEIHDVSRLIWEKGVESPDAPYDLLLKRYCERKQNLYTTRVSLVQHIGQKSTGLGGGHRSPTFNLPWPKPNNGLDANNIKHARNETT